ncbi:FHA domain-containing protein [Amycolatopsis sp. cmx-4-83]|uniref:FHA domain-containing protein n=1 Tax=Amycolatopsis sp. cmx-4-83 TaxID=2790940 RepID=UPI00397DEDCB
MAEARIETLGGSGARPAARRGSWLFGRGTWVADAGSRNGTWVNGRRLAPRQDHPLRTGDRLEFGPVAAVYSDGEGGARQTRTWERSSSGGVSVGDVSAGTSNNAGRDVNNSYEHRQHHDDGFTKPEGEAITLPATGKGTGCVLMVLGLLTILAGFGSWVSVIFRFNKAGSDSVSSGSPPLLGPEVFDGVPLGAVGFALFGLGGVVVLIGMVGARAAPQRSPTRSTATSRPSTVDTRRSTAASTPARSPSWSARSAPDSTRPVCHRRRRTPCTTPWTRSTGRSCTAGPRAPR